MKCLPIILFLINILLKTINSKDHNFFNKNNEVCELYKINKQKILKHYNKCIYYYLKTLKLKKLVKKKCFGKSNKKIKKKIFDMIKRNKKITKNKIKILSKKNCLYDSLCDELLKNVIKNLNSGFALFEKIEKGFSLIEKALNKNYTKFKNNLINTVKPYEICYFLRKNIFKKILIGLTYNLDSLDKEDLKNRYNINFDYKNVQKNNKILEMNHDFDLKDKYLKEKKHLIKMIPWGEDVSLRLKYKLANKFISEEENQNQNFNHQPYYRQLKRKINNSYNDNFLNSKVKNFLNIEDINNKIDKEYN